VIHRLTPRLSSWRWCSKGPLPPPIAVWLLAVFGRERGGKKKNGFGGIFWNQTRKVRVSSIDRHGRSLRLLGENQYPVSQVISGGEDAEEKIAARKRQQETQIKWGDDGKELPSMVTGHGQGPEDHPKGESAAIIAEKSIFLEMCLSDTGHSVRWGRAGDRMIIQKME